MQNMCNSKLSKYVLHSSHGGAPAPPMSLVFCLQYLDARKAYAICFVLLLTAAISAMSLNMKTRARPKDMD